MIGFVRGELVFRRPPKLVLDVQGIGYEVEAPLSVFDSLPPVGTKVRLFTQLVVREDAHNLYGFQSETDRELFRTLIRISGVGAKLALGILSGMSVAEFAECVQGRDTARLKRLPGIGQKTAERLVVEMADRVPAESVSVSVEASVHSEALAALVALGYRQPEAERLLTAVSKDQPEMDSEALIRAALRRALKG